MFFTAKVPLNFYLILINANFLRNNPVINY
jgi:hypothetical protein